MIHSGTYCDTGGHFVVQYSPNTLLQSICNLDVIVIVVSLSIAVDRSREVPLEGFDDRDDLLMRIADSDEDGIAESFRLKGVGIGQHLCSGDTQYGVGDSAAWAIDFGSSCQQLSSCVGEYLDAFDE